MFLVSWWGPKGWGPEGWGPEGWGPEGWGPEGWGPAGWGPEGWGPAGWGPAGWGPKGWGPKISRFFSPLPPQFFCFFPSLLVFFVEFWWCLKRRDPQMCTFGVPRLSCASTRRCVAFRVSNHLAFKFPAAVNFSRLLDGKDCCGCPSFLFPSVPTCEEFGSLGGLRSGSQKEVRICSLPFARETPSNAWRLDDNSPV